MTFTAAVSSASPGTPTGAVQFKVDGTNAGAPAALNSGGVATFTTASLSAGMHTVTAEYSGDANFSASTGALAGGQVVGGIFQFSQGLYTVAERAGSVTIAVRRSGDTSGAASVDYATDDGSDPAVAVPCSSVTGIALERCDYTRAAGTLNFAAGETEKTFTVIVNDDSYTEGTEATSLRLSNPGGGASLGAQSSATLQITDDSPESAGNPSDDDAAFVTQHYHDFLNREPDAAGLKFWADFIRACGADQQCRQVRRVNVSAAFFLSIEFKETGYLVIRAHKAAFGDDKRTPRYAPFLRDQREVGEGLVVGQGNWQAQLETNKQAYLQEFVSRPEYVAQFPQGQAASAYVDKLFSNAGATPTPAERSAAITAYGAGDAAGRAAALRSVIESGSVFNAEYNEAFVVMEYYGYLRRNPDSAPDSDFSGYDFWLAKLDSFSRAGEDMRDDSQAQARVGRAEMVRAFIESTEYRRRFGP